MISCSFHNSCLIIETIVCKDQRENVEIINNNNNVSFEGSNIHYHSSSYQTSFDTNNNVCFEGSNIHYNSSSYQTSFNTNNNVCFEGSNIHYHSSSYQTSFNTNNNVGFNLHNCLYFLYLSTLLQHITYWFYLHLNIA
jgi:hypothetical protein